MGWARGTGRWWRCWVPSWAGKRCFSSSSWPRSRGPWWALPSSLFGDATCATPCPWARSWESQASSSFSQGIPSSPGTEASSMGDARRQSLRLAVGMALLVVGLVEIQSVLQAVRSERRLRDRVVGAVREELLAALPAIRAALAKGGPESWDEAARLAIATSLASEVEIFGESGRQLLSRPAVPPVGHWPGAVEQESLRSGKVLTVAAQSGPAARALTYVPFST